MTQKNKISIVIIEDDSIMAEMIKDNLSITFPGIQTIIYSTGESALEKMEASPDMVILDYQLDSIQPQAMDGLQVLIKLKKKFPLLPVVFFSSNDHPDVAANTIIYGAHDFIIKNELAFQKLELIINKIIDFRELKKSAGDKNMLMLIILILSLIIGGLSFFILS
jgi:DNA-binding NarL/FixJ family response regulator